MAYGYPVTDTGVFRQTVTPTGYPAQSRDITVTLVYDGDETITVTVGTPTPSFSSPLTDQPATTYSWSYGVSADSTVYANDYYIDLDIGACYTFENFEMVPINENVTLPAELPTLKPGANIITFDNTITQLKIAPKWWKV